MCNTIEIIEKNLVVTVDLTSKCLKPGKALYERVKTCLQKLKADVILQWEPENVDQCPSSVAFYFSKIGYKVKQCKIHKDSDTIFDVSVPVIENSDEFDEVKSAEFVEWLGMLTINGSTEEESDYISTYATPEPAVNLRNVKVLRWRGFFNVCKVIDFIKEIKSTNSDSKYWKAVYFQGFSDSPVAWEQNEHHFYTNGDNGGVVILNQNEFFLCTQKCSNKCYK